MSDQSTHLRMRLASIGIFLDEKKPEPEIFRPPVDIPVDRDRIRSIIIAAGAPDKDVEWLTNSCPSVDSALTYRPTPKAGP